MKRTIPGPYGFFGEADARAAMKDTIIQGDGFYVSYNDHPWSNLFSSFESDLGGPETALCYPDHCDILNGDFREEYRKLVPLGLAACRDFYRRKSAEAGGSWTIPEGD